MSGRFQDVWSFLSSTPLVWLVLTLVVYQGADALHRRTRFHALFHPVLLSIVVISGLLLATGVDYSTYFNGAKFIHFLLGPATVALAVPLYRYWATIRRSAPAVVIALLAGSLTAIGTAWGFGTATGAAPEILRTLAPKSVTTPIAMGIAEKTGGIPSLAAVVVILTGIVGAAFGGWVLDLCRVKDPKARGMAWGVAAHGLGTARALRDSAMAGAFAGLAMGLNGIATAFLVPALMLVFG